MKRNKWEKLLILSIALLVLTACFNKKQDIDKKEDKKKESEKQLSEEEKKKLSVTDLYKIMVELDEKDN